MGTYDWGGFLYSGGEFSTIGVPEMGMPPWGINDSGDMVGGSRNGGFLYTGGSFTWINFPGAGGIPSTFASGINDSGDIVGYYSDVIGGINGFLYASGIFSTINFPGASGTIPNSINNSRDIVGYYLDSNGGYHGFLATPVSITVAIDVKPLGECNIIDWRFSRGQLAVAILSSPDFYAPGMLEQNSLTFGRTGDEPSFAFCNKRLIDVNGDGQKDLLCHFYKAYTDFQCGDTEGILRGQTKDGKRIERRDLVRVVPCR